MNKKYILLTLLIISTVFLSGCFAKRSGLNPYGKCDYDKAIELCNYNNLSFVGININALTIHKIVCEDDYHNEITFKNKFKICNNIETSYIIIEE